MAYSPKIAWHAALQEPYADALLDEHDQGGQPNGAAPPHGGQGGDLTARAPPAGPAAGARRPPNPQAKVPGLLAELPVAVQALDPTRRSRAVEGS